MNLYSTLLNRQNQIAGLQKMRWVGNGTMDLNTEEGRGGQRTSYKLCYRETIEK